MKKQQLKDRFPQYDIGDYSYGRVKIMDWHDKKTVLKIGKFCSFAEGSQILLGGEHNLNWTTTYPFNNLWAGFENLKGHPTTKGDIKIGNDVFVGTEAMILSGVVVGDGAVIGARSLVTKDVASYSIVVGSPASLLKYRFGRPVINELLKIRWWEWEPKRIYKAIPYLQNDAVTFLREVLSGNL